MTAIVDERMPKEAQMRLASFGFDVIALPPFPRLAPSVSSHPDMLMLPLGDRLFVYKEYYEAHTAYLDAMAQKVGRPLCAVDTAVSSQYPDDVGLNLFVLGKYLVGRTDKAPAPVLDYAKEQGYAPIFVKQGYAKCSTVILGETAIITADPSILAEAKSLSIKALSISAGGVSLPGYDYGFIGGTCGVHGNQIFFCGSLNLHPNGSDVAAFCKQKGFEIISLCDAPLLDVGSIFFL